MDEGQFYAVRLLRDYLELKQLQWSAVSYYAYFVTQDIDNCSLAMKTELEQGFTSVYLAAIRLAILNTYERSGGLKNEAKALTRS